MFVRRVGSVMEPVVRLRNQMDELFEGVCGGFPRMSAFIQTARNEYPAVNVWETDKAVFVEVELPGLTLENVELSILGNRLTVKGERKNAQTEGVSFHRRERGVGSFCRMVKLNIDVDAANVAATLTDGVLTVELPKAKETLPRKIEVKS